MTNAKARKNNLLPPDKSGGRRPFTKLWFNSMQLVFSSSVPGTLPLSTNILIDKTFQISKRYIKISNWKCQRGLGGRIRLFIPLDPRVAWNPAEMNKMSRAV